jgi:hypothetical protein
MFPVVRGSSRRIRGTAIREALAFLVCHPAIQVWQEYGQETDQRQERADMIDEIDAD